MDCQHCKKNLIEGAKFCPFCGEPVSRAPQSFSGFEADAGTLPSAEPPTVALTVSRCESCGAPTVTEKKLCHACERAFESVLRSGDAADAPGDQTPATDVSGWSEAATVHMEAPTFVGSTWEAEAPTLTEPAPEARRVLDEEPQSLSSQASDWEAPTQLTPIPGGYPPAAETTQAPAMEAPAMEPPVMEAPAWEAPTQVTRVAAADPVMPDPADSAQAEVPPPSPASPAIDTPPPLFTPVAHDPDATRETRAASAEDSAGKDEGEPFPAVLPWERGRVPAPAAEEGATPAAEPWRVKGPEAPVTPAETAATDVPWWERNQAAGAVQPPPSSVPPVPAHLAPTAPHAARQQGMPLPFPAPPAQERTPVRPKAVVPLPPVPASRPARNVPALAAVVLVAAAAIGAPVAWYALGDNPSAEVAPVTQADAAASGPAAPPSAASAGTPGPAPAAATPKEPSEPAAAERARTRRRPAKPVESKREEAPEPEVPLLTASTAVPVSLPAGAAPPPPPPPVRVDPVPLGQVYEQSQVDEKPQVASRVDPQVPPQLAGRAFTDVVILRVLVSRSGRPAEVQVLRKSRIDPALDTAAIAAVRQWTFSPARRKGEAVSCWHNVGVPFQTGSGQ